jgi:uncharacterized protein YndB with AHSA1/START domain
MGRLVVNNAMTINGAFEAPSPEPDGWLVLDPTATPSRWSSSWWPTRWCWAAGPTRAWTYRKVEPRQRLEFVQRFADQAGNQLDPADLGLPAELPREVAHVVTFKAVGDGATELTVTEHGYPSQQLVDLSRAGMEQVLDKLAESLK